MCARLCKLCRESLHDHWDQLIAANAALCCTAIQANASAVQTYVSHF